jgi:hypothetical protein
MPFHPEQHRQALGGVHIVVHHQDAALGCSPNYLAAFPRRPCAGNGLLWPEGGQRHDKLTALARPVAADAHLAAVQRDTAPRNVVRRGLVWSLACRVLLRGSGESLVRDSDLDVVGFTGENRDRFVLRLPPETCDGPIVSTAVGTAGNAKRGA